MFTKNLEYNQNKNYNIEQKKYYKNKVVKMF